ncbi:MAG: GIY-YIG nuclease family protein [Candidatus Dojkabacteria bacterium]|nr:MAG: GIY-YIG nuclease family protein [Candidatus Dojkabacteria bacterium]
MRYYVYILRSENYPDKTYVGYTSDLRRRLYRHNGGFVASTQRFLPWRLETYISFSDRLMAMRFERYLKTGSGIAFKRKRFSKSR